MIFCNFFRKVSRLSSAISLDDPYPDSNTLEFGLLDLTKESCKDPAVDIVAIHGLGGHRQRSWTTKHGTMWLDDLLPSDVPNARILVYGYDSHTIGASPRSSQGIHHHASQLVENLVRERSENPRRPIIFVAHSLGGIIVKHALLQCTMAKPGNNEDHKWIKVSTYGVLFFGTPHQGANGVEFARVILNIARIGLRTDGKIMKSLSRNSDHLRQLSRQYTPISGDFRTV